MRMTYVKTEYNDEIQDIPRIFPEYNKPTVPLQNYLAHKNSHYEIVNNKKGSRIRDGKVIYGLQCDMDSI